MAIVKCDVVGVALSIPPLPARPPYPLVQGAGRSGVKHRFAGMGLASIATGSSFTPKI